MRYAKTNLALSKSRRMLRMAIVVILLGIAVCSVGGFVATGLLERSGRGWLPQACLGNNVFICHVNQGLVELYYRHLGGPSVHQYAVAGYRDFNVYCATGPAINGPSIQINSTWVNLSDTHASWKHWRRTVGDIDWGFACEGRIPGYFRVNVWHDRAWRPSDTTVRGPFPSNTAVQLSAPFWFPTLISLLLALWLVWPIIRSSRERRRFTRGLCPKCGYDLRATPGRCPECGWRLASPSSAKD